MNTDNIGVKGIRSMSSFVLLRLNSITCTLWAEM